MSAPRIAILGGVRTPFCKAGGPLKDVAADDLGTIAVREVLSRCGLRGDQVDEVVLGNVAQPTHAANIARVITRKAGMPDAIVAYTVHHNCASGIQAVTTAAEHIAAGRSGVAIAGGTESMSQIPLLFGPQFTEMFIELAKAKTAGQRLRALARFRPSFLKPIIALQLGLTDPVCELNMGQTAEVLAREFGITRQEQDAFALESHRRAVAADQQGLRQGEVVPVIGPPDYSRVQAADDGPRPTQTADALAKLRPYFDRQAGTVTVGNSCPVTDGAAAVILASEDRARALGVEPIGWLGEWAYMGLDGRRMGLGPVYATARLLKQSGRSLSEFDLIEMNEAFAAQVIANERAFASSAFAHEHLGQTEPVGEIDREKLNVNGGAIAIGHPVGATGARLIVTLLGELKRRGKHHGLATLCVGGGQGAAIALEAA